MQRNAAAARGAASQSRPEVEEPIPQTRSARAYGSATEEVNELKARVAELEKLVFSLAPKKINAKKRTRKKLKHS
jgi:hypothetical protein